jgi:hypothetical protein
MILLMFALSIFGKPSPPEKAAPTFPTVTNEIVASGNVSSETTATAYVETEKWAFPIRPAILLEVDSPAQPNAHSLTALRARATSPPPWASDEQRGIRRRNRGKVL